MVRMDSDQAWAQQLCREWEAANMTRRKLRWIKKAAMTLGAGFVFGSMTCVQNVADTVGTGLSITGATGILGGNSQTVSNIGAGLDFVADLIRFSPGG